MQVGFTEPTMISIRHKNLDRASELRAGRGRCWNSKDEAARKRWKMERSYLVPTEADPGGKRSPVCARIRVCWQL